MHIMKCGVCATIALICMCFYPQMPEAQDQFTSASFLTWDRQNQDFYIRTSVGMAGLIAARNDGSQGDCVDEWYFGDETAANNQILEVMRTYPDYHPRGVIVAVMEKRCGSIIY